MKQKIYTVTSVFQNEVDVIKAFRDYEDSVSAFFAMIGQLFLDCLSETDSSEFGEYNVSNLNNSFNQITWYSLTGKKIDFWAFSNIDAKTFSKDYGGEIMICFENPNDSNDISTFSLKEVEYKC